LNSTSLKKIYLSIVRIDPATPQPIKPTPTLPIGKFFCQSLKQLHPIGAISIANYNNSTFFMLVTVQKGIFRTLGGVLLVKISEFLVHLGENFGILRTFWNF